MTINFIPNDPNARNDMPARQQPARPDRPAGRATFSFVAHQPEQTFEFGTTDFLFWQSREAALAAIDAWEAFAGPLTSWADRSDNPRRIDLSPIFDGDPEMVGPKRLNAFYDGEGVRFFDFDNGEETIFSGNSTDTVSHEVGHALLDSQRPELFQSFLPEVNAFHEGFADCVAILTALADRATRVRLLQVSADLGQPNFLEANSEYLSAAIKKQFGDVNPSQPRHALNNFKWQLPNALPAGKFEDPPSRLSREAHNFSRVFSGAFYDVLRGIFALSGQATDDGLADAATKAGRLLVTAVRSTPETPRYFQAIGRAMVIADDEQNEGANRAVIGKAFSDHGILLGSAAMVAPTAALAGPPPAMSGSTAKIAPATLADLRERIRAKGARFEVRQRPLLGDHVAEAVHRREVSLGHIHSALRGVVAYAAEAVLVGGSGPRAAILGALPEPNRTMDEVSAYVETLINYNRIAPSRAAPKAARRARGAKRTALVASAPDDGSPTLFTHVIRSVGGKKVLTRVRYLCGCCR
jgi:hypothetical protein